MDALAIAAVAALSLLAGYFMGRADELRASNRQRMDRIRDKRF